MQLKSRDDVQAAVNAARGEGFAAAGDVTDEVVAACGPLEGFASFEAIPFFTLLEIAFQVAQIIFGGDGAITIDKIKAVVEMLKTILG